ncbi:MAG: ABC transporter substrate-binding protein [Clostridia bacterium]
MNKYKVWISFVLILAMLAASFTIVNAGTAKAPEKILNEASFSDPRTLNPILMEDTASSDIVTRCNSALLKYDKNINLVPYAAESMPTVSKDGKTITFKLRKNIKWHDGVEFTSADVKFTYEMILDPKVMSPRYGDFLSIDKIETPDKYTVVFKLKKADSIILHEFANEYLIPKHIWEKEDRATLKQNPKSRKIIGIGPFKFVEWKTAERIVLEKNPDFFFGDVKLDKYIISITPSTATALIKLEKGEANFVQVPEAEVSRIKKLPGIKVVTVQAPVFDYLGYNTKTPFFSDKRVRQAIAHALNKNAFAKGIYKGLATPAETSYPPAFAMHERNVRKYNYDLNMSKKLLDEAGWKVGRDGIREKNGVKFKVSVITNKGNVMREKAIVLVQSALKPLGIAVEPRILEWNTMWEKYVDIGKYELVYGGMSLSLHGNQDGLWHSDPMIGYFNKGRYANTNLDKIWDLARAEFDTKAQNKLYSDAQKMLAEDQPWTFTVYRTTSFAVKENVYPTIYNILEDEDFYNWDIR